jgi:hypothetical protein
VSELKPLKTQLLQILGFGGRGKKRLTTDAARDAIPGKTGIGRPPAGAQLGGVPISPPLVEIKDTRQFHAVRELKSSDGLFVFTYQPIREIDFVDRAGRRFGFIFQDLP